MEKVTEKTVLAMIDTVTRPTGLLMPFEKLVTALEERGGHVLLDAAHGIGMIDLDLDSLGASFTTSNCHKWHYWKPEACRSQPCSNKSFFVEIKIGYGSRLS